jgi:transcriptional regulator with XRE-family HTH domain
LDFQYKYDLSSLFDYFKFVNVTQFAKTAGISSSLMRQYKTGNTYISEKQLNKIERALHKIGRELSSARLI